jgi:hypothetical protein
MDSLLTGLKPVRNRREWEVAWKAKPVIPPESTASWHAPTGMQIPTLSYFGLTACSVDVHTTLVN